MGRSIIFFSYKLLRLAISVTWCMLKTRAIAYYSKKVQFDLKGIINK